MSMINCPECGEKISDKSIQCVHCGCPSSEYTEVNEFSILKQKHTPKCPTCGSTLIHKIELGERFTSLLFFGLFSRTPRSSFVCNNCEYMW